jgi:hypothetical protein
LKVSIFTSKWKLSASTSITGNVSGAVANISNVIIKTYAIGDKAIWEDIHGQILLATLGILILDFLLDVTNWKKMFMMK